MGMIVTTSTPNKLLRLIKAGIDDKSIATWSYDSDGAFTHTTPSQQWADAGKLFVDVVEGQALLVRIVGPDDDLLKVRAYAIYLGRFAEMLLAHFDKLFSAIQISALLDLSIGDEH